MYNWTMRAPSETLVGRIKRVYVSGGITGDGDTNIVIEPDVDHLQLEFNRHGLRNGNTLIECEVHVPLWGRLFFNRWVKSLSTAEVTARGVYVDDDEHSSKTELHPVDLILGRVTDSLIGDNDWVKNLARYRGLKLGVELFAYRYAAASDSRKSWPFFVGPPLADSTRTVDLPIELPPRPNQGW